MIRLPIATGIDDACVVPLLVTLTSLKDHLRPGVEPVLYLLNRALRPESLSAIGQVVEVRSVTFDAAALQRVRHRRFPPEAASPLLLADLLAREERILFLDADLLVLDDVTKLWETNLEGHALAAVQDTAIPLCQSARGVKNPRDRGIPRDAPYFNAGVMLIDLDAWRRRGITTRAFDYLRLTDRVDLLHQEALNAVAWNDWLALPPRWNVLAGLAGRPFANGGAEEWRDPGIVHFAGRLKPWCTTVGGRFGEQYAAVLERVGRIVPPPPRTLKDACYGFYDRRLRDSLYPLESFLWSRRII